MHAIRNSHKIQETARYRDEDEEKKAKFEAKNRGCIRCEHKRDTMRMPEMTSAQEVPWRITASRREGQVRTKTRMQCRQAAQDLHDDETRHESREVQAHEHEHPHERERCSGRNVRTPVQRETTRKFDNPDLTSRGGVLEQCVCDRRPHDKHT